MSAGDVIWETGPVAHPLIAFKRRAKDFASGARESDVNASADVNENTDHKLHGLNENLVSELSGVLMFVRSLTPLQ